MLKRILGRGMEMMGGGSVKEKPALSPADRIDMGVISRLKDDEVLRVIEQKEATLGFTRDDLESDIADFENTQHGIAINTGYLKPSYKEVLAQILSQKECGVRQLTEIFKTEMLSDEEIGNFQRRSVDLGFAGDAETAKRSLLKSLIATVANYFGTRNELLKKIAKLKEVGLL